jgi:eukaryotic-like serine/threonine-protein kinase
MIGRAQNPAATAQDALAEVTLFGGTAPVRGDGLHLPELSWALPGDWPQRGRRDAEQATEAVPGPWRIVNPVPAEGLFIGWNRYRDVELTGVGGMGRVYRARSAKTGETVALKLLVEGRRRGDELWEASLQARVHHPSVLPVFDSGRLGGFPWFSMPYVEGSSLKAARPCLDLAQSVALIAKVARAAAAIHAHGIVHCDLNPRNILVGRRDGELHPWVIDFGIAQQIAAPAPADVSRVVGTPAYMAPEQALGHYADFDARTDIYALGATLYEMATGRRPFSAETSEAVLTKAIREEPKPLHDFDPAVPARLERIVLTCLEKDPEDRYLDAEALARDLEDFLLRPHRLAA